MVEEEVKELTKFVKRISSVEIPVTDLEASVEWYTKHLGLSVQFQGDLFAMLTFNAVGVPGVFLCKTESGDTLQFKNTNTDVTHSIIDFYTKDLAGFHQYLNDKGIETGQLNMQDGFGGFGFKDPDGNLLGATKAVQRGQE